MLDCVYFNAWQIGINSHNYENGVSYSTIGKHSLACKTHKTEFLWRQKSIEQRCFWACLLHDKVISLPLIVMVIISVRHEEVLYNEIQFWLHLTSSAVERFHVPQHNHNKYWEGWRPLMLEPNAHKLLAWSRWSTSIFPALYTALAVPSWTD